MLVRYIAPAVAPAAQNLSLPGINVLMVANDSICHRYVFSPYAEDTTGRSCALNPTETKQK
ncbi:hypothetical protein [Klebsiella michiganensis]